MTRKLIFFVLPSLKAGGAERVLSYLANNLNRSKFDVTVVVFGYRDDAVYPVDDLHVLFLNKNRVIKSIRSLYMLIRSQNPDLVFGTMRHVNLLLGIYSMLFKKTRFIAREASVWSEMEKFTNPKFNIPKFIVKYLYRGLDAIVCQSSDIRNDLEKNLKIKGSKLICINNPITETILLGNKKRGEAGTVKFITVGRLSEEKGHERILKVLAKLKNYSYSYTILGSGPCEPKIRELADEFGILEQIEFIDYTSNVIDFLADSDFFLQGSYVEGFPNAVLESCSVGTPVIAFDCPGGTREIIEDDVNGILVSSDDDFLEVLQSLKEVPRFERSLVQSSVASKFAPQKIIKMYEDLFSSI